jgi:arylsulfatase
VRVSLLVLIAVLATPAARPQEPAPRRAPNVVLLLADDLGYGEVGSYGQTKIRTPHLDRLAREGMRFTQHYSGSPVCAPSRCVLLTGFHTGHAVVRDNWERGGWGPDQPEGQFPLPERTPTLAVHLKRAGYRTAAIGKWGLGGPGTSGHPNRQGFDLFFGYLCQRVAHNHYPTHLWRNEERVPLEGNEYFEAHQRIEEPLADDAAYASAYLAGTYAPDALIEEALAFVRSSGDQPFFLYFATPVPHVALQVPPEELEAYPEEWDSEPYLGRKGYLPHPSPRRGYAAMVTRFDHDVGRLLALLDELGLARDTIVLFSSDNGPTYNGGTDSAFFGSTGGLRGLKGSLYEGGIRVPFVVRWPGRVAAGSGSELPSGFQDVLPTVLDLAGAEVPRFLDGVSLAPTLLGEGEQGEHHVLYWEYRTQQAVRRGDWKGIRPHLDRGETSLELYHLPTDPGELNDVAGDNPGIVAELEGWLVSERFPSEVFPLRKIDDPEPEPEDTSELDDPESEG